MGQLIDISQEDQWQIENLSRPKGPKQSDHQRESQSSNTRRDCTHLTGATKFSKVDGNKAFFGMHLTKDASLLTTFNTHLGWYRCLWVPFGLKMSQDIFQMRMDDIVAQCPGDLAIHDDIFIYGKDDRDHDANINLFNVAQKEGLVFNSAKCSIKQDSITFFGGVFSAKGYSPDPVKIQGIRKMTPPQTKQELQSFLGVVNYLQTFVPHLSHHTELLWAILKKENSLAWDENSNNSFQTIKSLLKKALLKLLRYYDRNKPVTLQCDASLKRLGACIIQDGQPIAFASQSLTDTETHYAYIKRELLAIVFGCEKFHTYLYGRTFVVESDHKPLEMISMKNLIAAPVRLQRMLLRLQQYDMVIMYMPGKEMLLADALSRLPSRTDTEIKFNLRVDAISLSEFSRSHLTKIAAETQWNPILSTVHRVTLNGWLTRRKHVPRITRNYWDFRDELSINNDLLMKGEWVVILTFCRDSIMEDLHWSHAGINKAMSLARRCMYWPGMEVDVTDYIKRCLTCIDSSNLPVETLHPHEVPSGSWVKVWMDFFQDDFGKKHLIIADYFSKFPFVYPVRSSHHFKTIRYLQELFTTEGIPTIVVSDNGPPFSGDDFKNFAREFNFVHTTSSPHFHQSNGFIEAMVKKMNHAYKKTDGSPTAQAWALLQLRDTPIVADLPSPAEILHGRLAQGAVIPRCPKWINMRQIWQRLIEIQDAQKRHFDRAHRAKDLLSSENQWASMFLPQQTRNGRSQLVNRNCEWDTWLWSFIHDHRSEWESLQEKQSSLETYLLWQQLIPEPYNSREGWKAQIDSFRDPNKDRKKVKTVSFQTNTVDFMARAMIFDQQSDNHPSHPPSHQHYLPRSPSYSPPSSVPSRESSVQPDTEEATDEGRVRYKSEPAFIWPKDIDRRLTTGLWALLQETSPLAPYKKERSAKAREAFSNMCWTVSMLQWVNLVQGQRNWLISKPLQKLTPFKTPKVQWNWLISRPQLSWLLSRPLPCTQHSVEIDSFQDPYHTHSI